MGNKLRTKIARFIGRWVDAAEHDEHRPRKQGNPRATAFETRHPGTDEHTTTSATEWANGEGYDIRISGPGQEKTLSLHDSEIDAVLACLADLGHFDE